MFVAEMATGFYLSNLSNETRSSRSLTVMAGSINISPRTHVQEIKDCHVPRLI